ncbi:MAG: DNA-deoxyinosine glycosylase [Clostridia bacterium]|nr:DNA-deoxyinosine glycosylase [Clostridia bacterium]
MPSHTIAPIFDENSKVLILGSFPSVKSREAQFFYGNPQNRFWRVMAEVLCCETPNTTAGKTTMLIEHGIALWDVIASCDISGSDDASISNVVPNDLSPILKTVHIERIFTNGGRANALYRKYLLPQTGMDAIPLPSTSPANARFDLESLVERWKEILSETGQSIYIELT